MIILNKLPRASEVSKEVSLTDAVDDAVTVKARHNGRILFAFLIAAGILAGFIHLKWLMPILIAGAFLSLGISEMIALSRIDRLTGGTGGVLTVFPRLKAAAAIIVGVISLLVNLIPDGKSYELNEGEKRFLGRLMTVISLIVIHPWVLPPLLLLIISLVRIAQYLSRRRRCTEEARAFRAQFAEADLAMNYRYNVYGTEYVMKALPVGGEAEMGISVDPSSPEYYYVPSVYGRRLKGWYIAAAVSFLIVSCFVGYDIWLLSHDNVNIVSNSSGTHITYSNDDDIMPEE